MVSKLFILSIAQLCTKKSQPLQNNTTQNSMNKQERCKFVGLFRLKFSPTIYPPIICLKRLFSSIFPKKESPDNI